MHLERAWIMLRRARPGSSTPAQAGSATQSLTVFVEDVSAHFERAKLAGARIVEDLHETEYGELQYGAIDFAGHHWLFSRHARDVKPPDWGAVVAEHVSIPPHAAPMLSDGNGARARSLRPPLGDWETTQVNKRPLAVIIVAALYILTGILGGVFHLVGFKLQHPFQYDIVWAEVTELVAILCGIYLLRGHNWARWLAMVWISFHVVLSTTRCRKSPFTLCCWWFLRIFFSAPQAAAISDPPNPNLLHGRCRHGKAGNQDIPVI